MQFIQHPDSALEEDERRRQRWRQMIKKKSQGSFTLFGEKMLSLGTDLPNISEHSMGMLSL